MYHTSTAHTFLACPQFGDKDLQRIAASVIYDLLYDLALKLKILGMEFAEFH